VNVSQAVRDALATKGTSSISCSEELPEIKACGSVHDQDEVKA
jgi:hypothetical protein